MHYQIANGVEAISGAVCETAFSLAWGISGHRMKTFREEIKGKVTTSRKITERTVIEANTLNRLQHLAAGRGFMFNRDQISAARMPNGSKAIDAFTWMQQFFDMIGDFEPAKK